MIQRIFATLIIAILYFFFALQSTLPAGVVAVTSLNQDGQRPTGELASANRVPVAKNLVDTSTNKEISVPVSPTIAEFDESDQSWVFTAKVIQLRHISIYGKTGTIAQIEYSIKGELRRAWAVIQIEDYRFASDIGAITQNQKILLKTSGTHVSSKGVNWEACLPGDAYCQYARFIEGGFPTSEDYNGLTICPSNRLIYSGDGSSDWINGMLAWKIIVVD